MKTKDAPKNLPVRIPREMVGRIDRLRGLVPRETYIRDHLLKHALEVEERKAGKVASNG